MKNKISDLLLEKNKNKYNLPDSYYIYIQNKGYLNKNVDYLITYLEKIVNKYNLHNKDILEIGSHFGIEAIIFRFLGVNHYTGIEFKKDSIDIANKVKAILNITDIEFIQGDVEKLFFIENSFDFVYCHSVVSHIPDYQQGYKEIFRVLKQNGVLFTRDENNFLKNRKFRRNNWEKADIGPKKISKGIGIEIPYSEIRKEILKKTFINIEQTKLDQIAKLTFGYAREELIDSAQLLLNGKKIKNLKQAREPISGYWAEREINPYNEMRILKRIGFTKTKIVSFYNRNKKRPFYKNIILQYLENNAWPFLFLDTHFNIEAKKTK